MLPAMLPIEDPYCSIWHQSDASELKSDASELKSTSYCRCLGLEMVPKC